MKLIAIFCAILIFWICNCTNPNGARRVLEQQGYTNIVITGWDAFACGEDDTFSTGFVATNPAGIKVRGVVCQGLIFKNSTIRFK